MSADYTPSDNEVRSMFCVGISDPTNPNPVPARQAYDGYDAWLRSVKAAAWDEGRHAGVWNATNTDDEPFHDNPYGKTRT